jgi:hypothetical protein
MRKKWKKKIKRDWRKSREHTELRTSIADASGNVSSGLHITTDWFVATAVKSTPEYDSSIFSQ